MKNDLIFADQELRNIPVADDAVFRMANARAAIARALEKCQAAELANEKQASADEAELQEEDQGHKEADPEKEAKKTKEQKK